VRNLWIALAAVAWIGCETSLDGFPLPREARDRGATFTVQHQVKDKRQLDRVIARRLQQRGLELVSSTADADYVVSYVDRWYWDMRNYLIDLRIDVRDAKTNVLVATGRSFQTSLGAMGETPETLIDRTLDVVVNGVSPTRP
jgi:hypothetical protein